MKYWLIKSEPLTYSIDNLEIDKTTPWTGIRNYQARNYIRDGMSFGDMCLFYHSSTKPAQIGVVGICKVSSDPYPDPTAKDPKSEYYEPRKNISWYAIDMTFIKKFKHTITLSYIKGDSTLKDMIVAKKGMRLSIQPVSKKDFDRILEL